MIYSLYPLLKVVSGISLHPERVEIKNLNKVTADHAYLEGEGNRSLEYWRKVHKDFFEKEYYQAGKVFTDRIPCICETFKVVYK